MLRLCRAERSWGRIFWSSKTTELETETLNILKLKDAEAIFQSRVRNAPTIRP